MVLHDKLLSQLNIPKTRTEEIKQVFFFVIYYLSILNSDWDRKEDRALKFIQTVESPVGF